MKKIFLILLFSSITFNSLLFAQEMVLNEDLGVVVINDYGSWEKNYNIYKKTGFVLTSEFLQIARNCVEKYIENMNIAREHESEFDKTGKEIYGNFSYVSYDEKRKIYILKTYNTIIPSYQYRFIHSGEYGQNGLVGISTVEKYYDASFINIRLSISYKDCKKFLEKFTEENVLNFEKEKIAEKNEKEKKAKEMEQILNFDF